MVEVMLSQVSVCQQRGGRGGVHKAGQGYPSLPPPLDRAGWLCKACSTPLVFRQEDFLVQFNNIVRNNTIPTFNLFDTWQTLFLSKKISQI